jgi:hypothetical protein
LDKRSIVVVAVALAAAACGGKVEVVPGGAGGFGGGSTTSSTTSTTSTTNSTTSTTSTGLPGCDIPPPVGALQGCSAAAGGGECVTAECDQGSNSYEADCMGGSCTCRYVSADGSKNVACACDAGGDVCAGSAKPCCGF